jgi:hypothetical protein
MMLRVRHRRRDPEPDSAEQATRILAILEVHRRRVGDDPARAGGPGDIVDRLGPAG